MNIASTQNANDKCDSIGRLGLIWPFSLIDFTAVALELLAEFCVSFDVTKLCCNNIKPKGYRNRQRERKKLYGFIFK